MYNCLRKGFPDEREQNDKGQYLNKNGSVSKVQPKPLFHREPVERTAAERIVQFRKIQDEFLWINAVRAGELPVIKNPTWQCAWDCAYHTMCELQDRGGDAWEDYRDTMYQSQDPYEDHRMVKSSASD
jgi:hypothetical protein